jgi:spermidine synthase
VGTRLSEGLNEYAGFYLDGGEMLVAGETAYQRYEVWDTPLWGRLLRLDDFFMTAEREEFFYHESLIHVPTTAHPNPRRALIIGGGDGGSTEELLKHACIDEVVLVELDGGVIDLAREYLGTIHRGAFDDPRVELRVEDGMAYVRRQSPGAANDFDLIVLDLTDPIGPATALYAPDFLTDCKARLGNDGALVLHIGAPVFERERVRGMLANVRQVFNKVSPYFVYIPLYGSLWGMIVASDSLDPRLPDAALLEARLAERGVSALQYYNGEVHHAMFALPNYLRQLCEAA